ncbi:MAG: azurin [Thermomonas sp.]
MNTRITLLTASCALALMACSEKAPAPAEPVASAPTATEAAPPAEPMASETPMATATPEAAPAAAMASDKPAAVVANCATQIEGNDAMQFNVGSIVVPASCANFTINLKHAGQMPVAAMGHNVVIAKTSDMQGIEADGMGAGVASNYVKEGDTRVIAHSKLVGGGESTSVTFAVSKIKDGGPYDFFCSFPGHATLMKGSISVQ